MAASYACSASAGCFSHGRSGPEKQSEKGWMIHEKYHIRAPSLLAVHHGKLENMQYSPPPKTISPILLTKDQGEGKDSAALSRLSYVNLVAELFKNYYYYSLILLTFRK